ncbi:exosome complex component CSL4 [Ditylenchus destructor]|nr:exosome complex component CSL4 [Ditylenchus destructor]
MASLMLDESILPGCSSDQSERRCVPGDKLFDSSEDYNAGNGCYEYHGSIYACLAGFVHVFPSTDEKDFTKNIVEVRNSFDEKGRTIPSPGSIVTARVESITLKFAKCAIICVGETLLNHEFNSTLRKEDVEIYKFVQPGDIILARVLGYGDSQTAYLLTIAEDELGVISGRGQNERTSMSGPPNQFYCNDGYSQFFSSPSMTQPYTYSGIPSLLSPWPLPPPPPPVPTTSQAPYLSTSYAGSTFSNLNPLYYNGHMSTTATNNYIMQSLHSTPGYINNFDKAPEVVHESEEIHLDMGHKSRNMRQFAEKVNGSYELTRPLGIHDRITRTVINNLAEKKQEVAKSTPDKKKKSPKSKKTTVTTQNVTIKPSVVKPDRLILESDDSDGEFLEMGRNWRIKSLFNCRISEYPTSIGWAQPQTDVGKTFPAARSTFYETGDTGFTAKQAGASTPTSSHGYVIGRTWIRSKPGATDIWKGKQKITPGAIGSHLSQKIMKKAIQRKFPNYSMQIINDKRIYSGTKECFQYIKGSCQAGVFCTFEHSGSISHQSNNICARLLRGLCRNKVTCPNGSHPLLPHQFPVTSLSNSLGFTIYKFPVCDYYLRILCSADDCPYLHVKHTDGLEPCENFNHGICPKGIMCSQPHRYYYSVVKENCTKLDNSHVSIVTTPKAASSNDSPSAQGAKLSDSPMVTAAETIVSSADVNAKETVPSTFTWFS